MFLGKSKETGLVVVFQLCKPVGICQRYCKIELLWHRNSGFLTIILGGRLPETTERQTVEFNGRLPSRSVIKLTSAYKIFLRCLS